MTVYVFGNPDSPLDDRAFRLLPQLKSDFPEITFVSVSPNADLPFAGLSRVYILDVVLGLSQVSLITPSPDKIISLPSTSVHDFDLGFQLKYLKKLGKLGEVILIGLPSAGVLDYSLVQSIFKKLVEQDMHGS